MKDGKLLEKVRVAYSAMNNGTGSRDDFERALDELNGPGVEGATEYLLLMQGGKIIRLNGRMTIFTKEGTGRLFSLFIRGGDCLVRTTRSGLLKQLNPADEIVLDPGNSPLTSPGRTMLLSEIPE